MNLLKKLAGETMLYGVSSILSRIMFFVILTPYFTRVFEEGKYGVVTLLFTYAGLLMVLYTYRMETAFFRFGNKKENLEKAFSTASISILFSTAVFTLILLAFLQPISSWLNFEENPLYCITVIFIIAFDALAAIPFARLRLENRPLFFAFLKTLNVIIYAIFIFLFLEIIPKWQEGETTFSKNKIQWVFIANLIASGAVLLFLLPMYRKIQCKFDKILWKKMAWYAAPLIIVGFAAVINQLIANPLLERLLPGNLKENLAQVGLYGAAAKLAVLMNLFTQAFNYAAEPFFFKNADRSDAKQIYANVAQAFTLVAALGFLGIMLYLDVIQYLLGKDFREGLGVVPILLMANLFLGLYYNFSIWYKLSDKTHFGAYISTTAVLITLGLNFWLIPNPEFGYYGAAWAAFGCYSFMAVAGYLTGQKYYPIPYPIWKMGLYILLAFGAYQLSEYFVKIAEPTLVLKLIFNSLILVVYIGGLFLLEKKSFQQMS